MKHTPSSLTHNNSVAEAVLEGLQRQPKALPSWLFYDARGDHIFQDIMRMPEYYLTDCEYELFQTHKQVLLSRFSAGVDAFRIVELGAGDGLKTEVLLQHFVSQKAALSYTPVDISGAVLAQLKTRLQASVPQLDIQALQADFLQSLTMLETPPDTRQVILFLGANIGNFSLPKAATFLQRIRQQMGAKDLLMVGFDLKKDPRLIQLAYDDPHGITRSFNLNLLVRLNGELGANFQLDKFSHYPCYDPVSGAAKSYLVSQRPQTVQIEALDRSFSFAQWELIHTEISQKYDLPMIEALAENAQLEIQEVFYDCKHYFCNVIFAGKSSA
ncbi:L-histidine N(alpha)-methyltransferase [Eisenibacter elegans]|uniref:L-histidine N(alpha)-methyltransferase n=1 Tax=Eisenibacter elegans TaxID=997 RepID=UPI0004289656|nr:L-histidine N(alpha)-methyltransferase [Eisenibacter elegans]